MKCYISLVVWITVFLSGHHVHGQGPPYTQSPFYAAKGTRVLIPCLPGPPLVNPKWQYQHGGAELRGKSKSYHYPKDESILILEISNVLPRDAGNFSCISSFGRSNVRLIVLDTTEPREIRVKSKKPTMLTLAWSAPLGNPEEVKGYAVYATELAEPKRTARFDIDQVSSTLKESFLLEDMTPGAKYNITMSAVYPSNQFDGETVAEGPASSGLVVEMPKLPTNAFRAQRVKAFPGPNSSIVVTWQFTIVSRPASLLGFKVSYKGKGKAPSGEVNVTMPEDGGKNWKATLENLKRRSSYSIKVTPLLASGLAVPSAAINYKHEGFKPELSVKAFALGPETVLVSYSVIGDARMSRPRMLYTDDTATKWKWVKNINVKEQHVILTGLQPRTSYYFLMKAKLGNKGRDTVTHVVTPPAGIPSPTNVTVIPSDEQTIKVTWEHDEPINVKGYSVTVGEKQNNGAYVVVKQATSRAGTLEAIVTGLAQDQQYRVKVTPYDLTGPGEATEPLLFRLAAEGEKENAPEPTTPEIVPPLPPQMEVKRGDRLEVTCAATGEPVPWVRWFKDGAEMGQAGVGKNVLVLERVDSSAQLVCRADNSAGLKVMVTEVVLAPEVTEPPKVSLHFTLSLPTTVPVDFGSDVSLICSATGHPKPDVQWFRNGVVVADSEQTRSVFKETNVTENFTLKCVASTDLERISRDIQVYIQNDQTPPQFVGDASPLVVNKGDHVNIPCMFTGSPIPIVTWYENDRVISRSSPAQNVIMITSVQESRTLVCRGESVAGRAEQIIQVQVRKRVGPAERIVVQAYAVPIDDTEVRVKWVVNRGDIASISAFTATLVGHNGQVLMRKKLDKGTRSLRLTSLIPSLRQTLILKTFTLGSLVDEENLDIRPTRPRRNGGPSGKMLHVDVIEIREDQAVVDIHVTGPSARRVVTYRLSVKELKSSSSENGYMVNPTSPSTVVEGLKPYRRYEVVVQAFTRNAQGDTMPILTESVQFQTAGPGRSAPPVLSPFTARLMGRQRHNYNNNNNNNNNNNISNNNNNDNNNNNNKNNKNKNNNNNNNNNNNANSVPTESSQRPRPSGTRRDGAPPSNAPDSGQPRRDPSPSSVQSMPGSDEQQESTSAPPASVTSRDVDTRGNRQENPSPTGAERGRPVPASELTTEAAETTTTTATMVPKPNARPDTRSRGAYTMNIKVAKTTPYELLVKWSVDTGNLAQIREFRFSISSGEGQVLVEQTLMEKQRSIKVSPLQPSTKYVINLQARNNRGTVLGEESLTAWTLSENARPDTARPRLYLAVNEIRDSHARLDWSLRGDGQRNAASFRLQVQDGGPGGYVMLSRNLSLVHGTLHLQRLMPDSRFYVTLDAIDQNQQPFIRSVLTFETPSSKKYGQPVVGSPQPIAPGTASSTAGDTTRRRTPATDPGLILTLSKRGNGVIRFRWELFDAAPGSVTAFRMVIRSGDKRGQVLVDRRIPLNTRHFDIRGLISNRQYYILLEAIATSGTTSVQVETVYNPARSPSEIKVSSRPSTPEAPRRQTLPPRPVPEQRIISTPPPRQRQAAPGLAIIRTDTTATTARLEWSEISPGQGAGSRLGAMVRYAEFRGNTRGKYNIQFVSSGQKVVVITGLRPATKYGFQVAPRVSSGQHVRWSRLVLYDTKSR